MRLKLLGLAAAALIGSSSLASAAVLVQTAHYGPQVTNWGTSTPISLAFPGFNTSLGTLTSLAVSVVQNVSGTVQLTNKSSSSAAVITGQLKNTWTAILPGILNGKTSLTGVVYSSTEGDFLLPRATGSVHNVSGTQTFAYSSSASDNLSPYESAFVIKASDLGSVVVSASNGNGSAKYTDLGELLVTVSYLYIANVGNVPEPATVLILGGSLFGLGLIRRRRP